MKRIGVITVARSDYGIYSPLLKELVADPELDLFLIAAGMHLSPEFGMTVQAIEEDGFKVHERVEMLLSSDSPEGISKSMGLGTIGFAEVYSKTDLDLLIVLGDRFEMHAAVVAAVPFNIPIVHIHGGELTEGAIDDSFRHSITKMSHLHFVSTAAYAKRVKQMGEEPWRVIISGALSLDGISEINYLSLSDLNSQLEINIETPLFLVTFHPVTLEVDQTEEQINEVLAALEGQKGTLLFTYPNADTSGRLIIHKIQEFVDNHAGAYFFPNLGRTRYFSLMKLASAMIGNSSSGIIEAASFHLPVVNIGNRQKGRIKGENVIDVQCDRREIQKAIKRGTSSDFQDSIKTLDNPYGDGQASTRIVAGLLNKEYEGKLILKKFCDFK
ncbi:MAG: UDP-N-acetylglucosamine 2-epimerase [Anaerolineales bacterium]